MYETDEERSRGRPTVQCRQTSDWTPALMQFDRRHGHATFTQRVAGLRLARDKNKCQATDDKAARKLILESIHFAIEKWNFIPHV